MCTLVNRQANARAGRVWLGMPHAGCVLAGEMFFHTDKVNPLRRVREVPGADLTALFLNFSFSGAVSGGVAFTLAEACVVTSAVASIVAVAGVAVLSPSSSSSSLSTFSSLPAPATLLNHPFTHKE